ncbi:MAG TPA: aminoacetone oxidase family FAD-binding enzyme [Vicinamibacterales bacterium]|nr:aminoacetone oxidase family FAD-binding enzyme [Vicinamibacterales bacterium]
MDVIVIGAGAAGLATAIFAARAAPQLRVCCLDGARHIGAKILVSGGSRCNVTNREVTERDFWGGSPRAVRNVLRAFPAERAAAFFETLGVALHEEEDGKLFPDSNRSRTVLDALLAEAARLGVGVEAGRRVTSLRKSDDGFELGIEGGPGLAARAVVIATGGRSLPKTGSDGFGYGLVRGLGHGYVETTPALAPMVLGGDRHVALAGVSHPAALSLRVNGRIATRLEGPLLWTHFGASGPVVLNVSRHWHRARLDGGEIELLVSVCPGETFESLEAWWLEQERERPRAQVSTVIATRLPVAIADAWIAAAGIPQDTTMAHVNRHGRRELIHRLVETRLEVVDSRGYAYAEVTAGGIPLDEIDPATMQSRVCPGLYLVGEILDVDGRLGGFNFQWAWSSGWVAGHAIAKAVGS